MNKNSVRMPLQAFVTKSESLNTENAIRMLLLNKEFCIQVGKIREELQFYKTQHTKKDEYEINQLIENFRIHFDSLSIPMRNWYRMQIKSLLEKFSLPISWRKTLFFFVGCGWAAEPERIKIEHKDNTLNITINEQMSFSELVKELRDKHKKQLNEELNKLPKIKPIKHSDHRKIVHEHQDASDNVQRVEAPLADVIHLSREWQHIKAKYIANDLADQHSLSESEVRAIASKMKNATKR
jgi:hypothetical protein